MTTKYILPIAATALALSITTATAAMVDLTFSGKLVANGSGGNTYNLDGADFVVTYTIDTAQTAYNAPTYGALFFSQFNNFAVDFSITNLENGAADVNVTGAAEGNIRNYDAGIDELAIFNNSGGTGIYDAFSLGFFAKGDETMFPQTGNIMTMSFLEGEAFDLTNFNDAYFYAYSGFYDSAAVRIEDLAFTYGDTPANSGAGVSAVPLPAPALLLLGSFGALAGLRRKPHAAT